MLIANFVVLFGEARRWGEAFFPVSQGSIWQYKPQEPICGGPQGGPVIGLFVAFRDEVPGQLLVVGYCPSAAATRLTLDSAFQY